MAVYPPDDNLCARWRHASSRVAELRETPQRPPPERLLQVMWLHQRLLRDQLTTLDGRKIRVLHPGFWNREAGPDFRQAVLQFNDAPPVTGDVEVDLFTAGWRGHRHDRNPAFSKVVLHVVWNDDQKNLPNFPTLALEKFLDAPLDELALWLGSEAATDFPFALSGQCSAPLRDLAPAELEIILNQAALVRLQRKAHDLQARARQVGWQQSLWEGIFRALGYKHNSWPMLRVAEMIPPLRAPDLSTLQWQARLFGLSGLVPEAVSARTSGGKYLRQLWEIWWREREKFAEAVLPKNLWRFHGLRPANRPERRLALAAAWLADRKFFPTLEQWFKSELAGAALATDLLQKLQAPDDPFWSCQWTFHSARFSKPQPLIGAARVTDLAVNVILPWFWARAASVNNTAPQQIAEQRYFSWPQAESNAVLELAGQRLLGSRRACPRTAAAQQGLLQIVRDYCDHSNAICQNCLFPTLVKQWHADKSKRDART
jgi:hypothetical protein